jgi:hypothetical protein
VHERHGDVETGQTYDLGKDVERDDQGWKADDDSSDEDGKG